MSLALPFALWHFPTCPRHPVSGRFLSTPLLPDHVVIPFACRTSGPWPPAGGRFLSTPPWSLPEGDTLSHLPLALPFALGHSPTCPGHPVSEWSLSTPLLSNHVAVSFDCCASGPWPPAGGRFLSTPPWSASMGCYVFVVTPLGWSLYLPGNDDHYYMQPALPVARLQLFGRLGHPTSGRFLSIPLWPPLCLTMLQSLMAVAIQVLGLLQVGGPCLSHHGQLAAAVMSLL